MTNISIAPILTIVHISTADLVILSCLSSSFEAISGSMGTSMISPNFGRKVVHFIHSSTWLFLLDILQKTFDK